MWLGIPLSSPIGGPLPLADIQASGSVRAYAQKMVRCQPLSEGKATDEKSQVPGLGSNL